MPVFRLLALLCLGAVAADAIAYASIRHWTTDNGARVYFAETHQIPMVQFTVGFDAGSARDPSSREGLSSLVARMVEEGAAAMDGEDIAAAFEAVGADFGAAAGRDIALERLARKGVSRADALSRLRAQMPVSRKKKLADFVIDNSGDRDHTRRQVERVYRKILRS